MEISVLYIREGYLSNKLKFMSYQDNIIRKTQNNGNFRRVLYTGNKTQLVAMSIPPGGDIGEETHPQVEQILFFLSGEGQAVLDGQISPVAAGDVVVVNPGIKHNFINTGAVDWKIYTVYAPANHIDGITHPTKADAEADVTDEEFGKEAK